MAYLKVVGFPHQTSEETVTGYFHGGIVVQMVSF